MRLGSLPPPPEDGLDVIISGRESTVGMSDVSSGSDSMSLKTIPDADGDACHLEWREMVLDDVVMVKFVWPGG